MPGFPRIPLPLRGYLALNANPSGVNWGYQWTNITQWMRTAAGVTVDVGRADEASKVDASSASLTLDNRDGRFSPRNPAGAWFGQLRKNTPIRLAMGLCSDTFTRTVSGSWGTSDWGHIWAHGGGLAVNWLTNGTAGIMRHTTLNNYRTATLDQAGVDEFVGTFVSSVPAMVTGAAVVTGMVARWTSFSDFYAFRTEFNAGGNTVTLKITKKVGGVETLLAAATPQPGLTYAAGVRIRTKVMIDGEWLWMKAWRESDPEPLYWQLGATDADQLPAGSVGVLSWVLAGNSNTLPFDVTFDDYDVEVDVFQGEVPEWPPRWDKSGKNATAPIKAAGVLRRLGQGQKPLRSPITRQFLGQSPIGYWPLEDDSGSELAGSLVNGSAPARVTGVEFGSVSTLPGAKQSPKLTATTKITGAVARHTPTTRWSGVFYFQLPAVPGSGTHLMTIYSSGSVARREIWAAPLGYYFYLYAPDGTLIANPTAAYTTGATPPSWVAMDCLVEQNGANTRTAFIWSGVGTGTFWFVDHTMAGQMGAPRSFAAFSTGAGLADASLAHILFLNREAAFVDGNFTRASNGYIGETASDRIQRLCDESGVPVFVSPGDSEPMGRQQVDTLLGLLRVAEETDMGILSERSNGLAYRPRSLRYNPPVALALDFADGDIAEPPEPTDDDQRVRNDWTVQRLNGATAQVVDQDHVDAVGRYDEAVTLNLAGDTDLEHHAGWRVHLGTLDEMRWPRIDLNLARHPTSPGYDISMIPNWLRVRVGSRVTVDSPPSQAAGDDIDLIVEGYSQQFAEYAWRTTLNCSPAAGWLVGVADDPDARADSDWSELSAGVSNSATSLSVAVLDGPVWTTDPAQFPFDVNIGGERVRATAISGAGPIQTWTVVRGIDGVALAHLAGTDVRLWKPVYAAL